MPVICSGVAQGCTHKNCKHRLLHDHEGLCDEKCESSMGVIGCSCEVPPGKKSLILAMVFIVITIVFYFVNVKTT